MKDMKKPALALVSIIIVAAVVAVGTHAHKKHEVVRSMPKSYYIREACDILNGTIAAHILGDNATKNQSTDVKATSPKSNVSYCMYSGSNGSTLMVVHSPLSNAAATANREQFVTQAKSQTVVGYGDSAYWDPATHQLNILKHETWYGLSFGSASDSSSHTLDQAKQLANLVKDKL